MLAAILTCCGTTTVLTSCDDDDVENVMETLNIVGTWKTIGDVTPNPVGNIKFDFYSSIEFKSDGTVVCFDKNDNKMTGTWSLRDRTLTIVWSYGGETYSETYSVQDGWTRDRMVITYNFTDEDESGKMVNYVVTITMNRTK